MVKLSNIPHEQSRATFGSNKAALYLYDIIHEDVKKMHYVSGKLNIIFSLIKRLSNISDKNLVLSLIYIYRKHIFSSIDRYKLTDLEKNLMKNIISAKIKTLL